MFSWITDEPLAILDLTDVHPRQFAQCYAGVEPAFSSQGSGGKFQQNSKKVLTLFLVPDYKSAGIKKFS
jgi:hypothetical protein